MNNFVELTSDEMLCIDGGNYFWDNVGITASCAGGGMIGGAIGSAICPGPGTIIGGAIGAVGGVAAYCIWGE